MVEFYVAVFMIAFKSLIACGTEFMEEIVAENKASIINEAEWWEDIDVSTYGLSEEYKELLKNFCWTVEDFAEPDEMDEKFWLIFLRYTYGAGWWRDMESVMISRPNYLSSNTEFVRKISYGEVENYTKLVFGVEWPGIKLAYEDMPEDEQSFFYEDGFYYIGCFDPLDKWYKITDCIMDEDNTVYVTVQHSIDDGGRDEAIVWETILTLKPADNENGFILTAKQTESISESR